MPEVSEAPQTSLKVEAATETAEGTHRSLVADLAERLFVSDVAFGPAVGDHVAGDGRVVDGQRPLPAHDQGCLVERLDLHTHRGAAAH